MKSLSGSIAASIKNREMSPDLVNCLLDKKKSKVIHRDESDYWDYKRELKLDNDITVAEFARDVIAFHNSKGGLIVVGIENDYKVVGITESAIFDSYIINDKIKKYTGQINIFQNSIKINNNKILWLIFIPKRDGSPIAILKNGPSINGKPSFCSGDFFIRINDQTKKCQDPNDFQRLFTNVSIDHLQAYAYSVDEPYFRLLAPHCDHFFGRHKVLEDLTEALQLRNPIVSLDGVGGVGKSAIAIEKVRHLYEHKDYEFIVSLSAKNKVWHEYTGSRQAGFSGLTELLKETASILQLDPDIEVNSLKYELVEMMKGVKGLFLIDNIEDIQDKAVLDFLRRDIPDPVRILVTSRVDRKLGAASISVPEMDDAEAKSLFTYELQRYQYPNDFHTMTEQSHINEVIRATGKLPLALKWAASLASSRKSLKDASSILRGSDTSKKEFLNFIFATMYDELSELSQKVALLCPFLLDEWNLPTISIALDKTNSDIKQAINELIDRGIVSEANENTSISVLPLTLDYLSGKWHENQSLRKNVIDRLADAITSEGYEGIFLNWPKEQRLEIVVPRLKEMISNGELSKAKKISDLALDWSATPTTLFMQGNILYERGDRSDGLAFMESAYQMDVKDVNRTLLPSDILYLASCLSGSGDIHKIDHILNLFEGNLLKVDTLTEKQITSYISYAIENRRMTSITKVLSKVELPDVSYLFALSIINTLHVGAMEIYRKKVNLDDKTIELESNDQSIPLIDTCGNHILKILKTSLKYQYISSKENELVRLTINYISNYMNKKTTNLK